MSDALAPLRAKFVARCAEDLAIVRAGPSEPELPRVIHRLAGVSGMFGFDDLGVLAQRLDAQDTGPSEGDLALLARALEAAVGVQPR